MLPKGVCFKGEASNVLVPSNCNLFTHGALRSSWELVEPCPCVLDPEPELFCACLTRAFPNPEALGSRMVPDWIGKTSRSKSENQQQTQPTYGVDARIRTRAILVGGECSLTTAQPWLHNNFLSPYSRLQSCSLLRMTKGREVLTEQRLRWSELCFHG